MSEPFYLQEVQEKELRPVLLVRAVEETDPDGRLLSRGALRQAAAEARDSALKDACGRREDWRYLHCRAVALMAEFTGKAPALGALAGGPSPGSTPLLRRSLPWIGLVLALALGLASAVIGPERRINLLSLPLFGIVAWNLTLYLLFALRSIRSRRGWGKSSLLASRWLHSFGSSGGEGTRIQQVEARFQQLWLAAAARLLHARGQRWLHLCAALVGIGSVAGMYLRGIAFAYRVTWESTFLEPWAVQRILAGLLTPASWLLGIDIPDVASLEAPGSGTARPWIHLFAGTLTLVVVLPRLGLVVGESVRIAWLRRRLPVDLSEVYFRRRLAEGRGEEARIMILPYSHQSEVTALDALRGALVEHLGSRIQCRVAEPLKYGEGLPESREEGVPLLLFPLGQTPEAEVHGELLSALLPHLDSRERWVVVDTAGWGEGDRRSQRQRSWRRIVEEAGFRPLVVDLAALPADELYTEMAAVLKGAP